MRFRRSLLSWVAFSLALGCQPETSCDDACGTAIIVTPGPFSTMFPPAVVNAADNEIVGQIFWKLADLDSTINTVGDAGFVPQLASDWTFESPTTIAFTIHPDARWHDGTPVTAQDVVFSWEVYTDPAIGAEGGLLMDRVERVTARDDRTAVFEFSMPYVEQFFDATYHMKILPRHLLDSIPRDRMVDHPFAHAPVGNGPYRFVRENSDGTIEMRADPDFFRGRPGIARLIWRSASPQAGLQALETGDADVTPVIIDQPAIERATRIESIAAIEYLSPYYSFLGFNLRDPDHPDQPHPLFGDREVRRALVMAVDRDTLPAAVLGPYASAPKGPFGPLVRTSHLDIPQIPYDLDQAQATLDSLGWTDHDGDGVRDRNGRPLRFTVVTPGSSSLRVRAAVQIQAQLRAVGAQLDIEEAEFGVFSDKATGGTVDAYMGSWSVDPSPSAVRGIWHSDAINGNNWSNYQNPRFDSLVEQARNATDPAVESALWREAYTVFNEDAVAIMAYAPAVYAGVHRRFENVSIRSDAWYATIWTWRVRPDAMIARDQFVQP